MAALGYLRLYRRRRARFVLAVALAFALLAEAMVAIAWARNWRVSWWEWHVLMLASFLVIAQTARSEWHEERFSDLYLDRTLAGARDVSIVLADLAGFTAYSERRDPAEVAEMLNAYFEAVVPMLEADGAEVHQIVGDEVMAVFNKQGDTPDHPERAARAALRLQEAAGRVAAAHPGWPRFRAGVNSGEALAGVVGGPRGHRKHGVVGDTVNLAARLEAVAEPGAVVIGEATYRRLAPGALAERLPPLSVKGKSEPVEAYVLRAVGSRTGMRATIRTRARTTATRRPRARPCRTRRRSRATARTCPRPTDAGFRPRATHARPRPLYLVDDPRGDSMAHSDTSIRNVMTPNPTTVEPSSPVIEAARIMRDEDVGPVPVVEGGRLVGMITDRDTTIRVVAEGKDPQATTVGEVMSRDLVTVDPQESLDEALRLMAEHQVRRVPVVEEDGRLAGIVAQADVAQQGADHKTGEVVQQISR